MLLVAGHYEHFTPLPHTPKYAPPSDAVDLLGAPPLAASRAADAALVLLQRLLWGRAAQVELLSGLGARYALVQELRIGLEGRACEGVGARCMLHHIDVEHEANFEKGTSQHAVIHTYPIAPLPCPGCEPLPEQQQAATAAADAALGAALCEACCTLAAGGNAAAAMLQAAAAEAAAAVARPAAAAVAAGADEQQQHLQLEGAVQEDHAMVSAASEGELRGGDNGVSPLLLAAIGDGEGEPTAGAAAEVSGAIEQVSAAGVAADQLDAEVGTDGGGEVVSAAEVASASTGSRGGCSPTSPAAEPGGDGGVEPEWSSGSEGV